MDPRFVVDLASALGETALRRARGRRVPRDWSVGYESLVRALQRPSDKHRSQNAHRSH